MKIDATHFIWISKPSLDTEHAIGTVGGNGKHIIKYATYSLIGRYKRVGRGKCTSPHILKPFKHPGYCDTFIRG
eukprot:3302421-Pleurochrysis_carterae.AAC.1